MILKALEMRRESKRHEKQKEITRKRYVCKMRKGKENKSEIKLTTLD